MLYRTELGHKTVIDLHHNFRDLLIEVPCPLIFLHFGEGVLRPKPFTGRKRRKFHVSQIDC